MIDYPNVPRAIGAVVSRRLATLAELQTNLGQTDLHDLLEIIAVDSHNERVAAERRN
ncbi:transcription elongation factor GreA [Burkholderia gladioli]|nr:transcription elongation factor GreA [Burkholderia gladioli]